MEKELHDLLYNKEAKDLTLSNAKYLNRLLGSKSDESTSMVSFLGLPIATGLFGLLIFLLSGGSIPLGVLMTIALGVGITFGVAFGLAFKISSASILKNFGITKEEWKELKKSGRLKELNKTLNSYRKRDFSKVDDLNNMKLEYESQLESVEENKQKLLSKLAEINKQIESNKEVKTDETPMLRKQIKNNSNIENKENEVVIENKEENTNTL